MKALVTGGAGLIGTHLTKKLLGLGYEVVAVDNLSTGSKENIQEFLTNPKFTFINHDIIRPFSKAVGRQLSAVSEIYHLACPTGVPNIKTLGEEMLLTSSLGTKNVLELGRLMGSKVLFTSSSEVYGDPEFFPQKENYSGNVDPTGFRSPYEEGKRFSETLSLLYHQKYALPVKIVRMFNTYGPTKTNDTRVTSRFLRQALLGSPITVYGSGKQTRTFCYVSDTVEGLITVMKKGKDGEVYNIGSDKEISVISLANLLIRLTGSKSKIKLLKHPFPDHARRKPDLLKIKKLGWRQKVSLEEGLKRTIKGES